LSTFGPLVVIFGISAVKEWFDDSRRAQADELANSLAISMVRNGRMVKRAARCIRVGDVVRVEDGQEVPCDLMLLYVAPRSSASSSAASPPASDEGSATSGECFVQTTNLDGETNFKSRCALPQTQQLDMEKLFGFNGVIQCAAPNADLYTFNSRLWLQPSPIGQLSPPLE
jgi:phospholipid-translocating ATPase